MIVGRQRLLATDQPNVDMIVRKHISAMLCRPAPDEEMTKDMIMKQYVTSSFLIDTVRFSDSNSI